MSKLQAFFISCLIYLCLIFFLVLFINYNKKSVKNIQFGNFQINIISTDFFYNDDTKQKNEEKNEDKIISNDKKENLDNKEEYKQDKVDINSLFDNVNINKPTIIKTKENIASKQIDTNKLNSILDSIKTTSSAKTNMQSAKIKGIYDEYLSAVNVYLTSIWNLILANSYVGDDKNTINLNYTIDKDGYIQIENINITSDDIFYQCVREFIKKTNSDKKNLGKPPLSKPYKGIIRLSKKLVVKEIL